MKVECRVAGYHPATGLDLVAGEMDVTEEQAAQLEAAGFLGGKQKQPRAPKAQQKED
jgi:hypothetical protein